MAGSERDVTPLHDQARPPLRVDPRSPHGINLSLRDPTGLRASLSDVDWNLILACEVQNFNQRRHALSSHGTRNARSD